MRMDAVPRSVWSLRATLFCVALVLVAAGLVLERLDVAGARPATTTLAPTTSTTSTTGTATTAPTTTTTLLAPGVEESAPRAGRTPSHCPLSLAPLSGSSATKLNLLPRRCTVLEIGDSLGDDLGWGLRRQLSGYPWLNLVQEDKSSSGLANSWFYDWPAHLATFLHQYHPNILVVCLGGNDQQNFYVKGVFEAVGSTRWRATYSHYVRQIVDIARGAGAQVLWVGLPVMEPTYYSRGAAMLDSLYAAAILNVQGTAYVPTWRLFATSNGAYRGDAAVNGVSQQLRAADGIHFSEVGENVLATYVLAQMSVVFHLPLRAAEPAVISSP
jgi:hypothetical protein